MKQICCIDCELCYDETSFDCNDDLEIRYFCQRGSVITEIEDPIELHDCADFVQFIEDI